MTADPGATGGGGGETAAAAGGGAAHADPPIERRPSGYGAFD